MHIEVAVGRLEVLVNSTGLHADQIALETICAALAEKSPSASTNTARDEIAAAEKLCKIYFDIAASCIGEEAVRQRVAAATSPVA